MTKIISFSTVEILPALLDKSKTQTIRPAWKVGIDHEAYIKNFDRKEMPLKPPRFKVGEKVQLMWKQRSKSQWFCYKCGNKSNPYPYYDINETNCENCGDTMSFPKKLGEGEITEVFKIITIPGDFEKVKKDEIFQGNQVYYNAEVLAKDDGFKSAEDMFAYFNKEHDLSEPKPFWTYRLKWL